jgi:mannose-6-phosphate isomerase-like protein (cupin superfamily)
VANATISLIESNRFNPSIGMLKKILNGIPMTLSDFFSPGRAQRGKFFFHAGEHIEVGSAPISLRQVVADIDGKAMMMLHETHQPGSDSGKTPIKHEGEECGYVISGQIELRVENQCTILGPGDAYYYDSRLPHRFRNIGTTPCRIVSVCSPPTF